MYCDGVKIYILELCVSMEIVIISLYNDILLYAGKFWWGKIGEFGKP